MPPALLDHTVAGVDQDHREVGRRGTGDHVAGVLDVPGGVGDDELALGRREVAVGDIDRDALLALGAQPVGQQREVGVLGALVTRGALDGLELVLEDRLAVVQQPPDQRALAVVDRASGRQSQQLHQKYPSRLRSSIAASEARSSARVAPRSVMRLAATSSMIFSTRVRVGLDCRGAGHVADGAVPHLGLEHLGALVGGVTSVTAISMLSRQKTGRLCA